MKAVKLALCMGISVVSLGVASLQAGEVTVKFWAHENLPRQALDEQLITQFEEQNPGIRIEATVMPPAQLDQRLQVAFAGGTGPTLFNNATFLLGQYAAAGILAPIDYNAAGVPDIKALETVYGHGVTGAEIGGVVYGLPTEVSNYACAANVDLWHEAGLDPATDAPKTWADMIKVAEKLTKRDENGVPVQRGFDFNWTQSIFMWLTFNAMVDQAGGQMVNDAALTTDMASPEVKQVMGYWNDWVNKYNLGGPQYTGSRDAFVAGELATECSFGSWGRKVFESNGINYAFFPVPRWSKDGVDTGFNAYAYFMMVNAHATPEEQQAAWKFAAFYTAHGKELYEVAGLFTTVPEVTQLPSYKADKTNVLFAEELNKAKFTPRIPGFNEVGAELFRARDRIVVGGEDTDTVLKELQARSDAILAPYR